MDVDDNYANTVGKFGRYQIFIYVVFSIYGLALPSMTLLVVFINTNPKDIALLNVVNSRVHNDSSVIYEWQLQDQTWVTDMVQSLYFVGFLVGVVLFGQISDKIGRKKAMIIGYHLLLPVCICTAFSPNYTVFAVLRAATGMLVGGATLVMFIYTQELVSRDRWAVTSSLGAVQFAVGSIIMIVVSYYIPAWRMLYIALTIPQVIPLIFTWFVPESPRWLYSKGRLAEAEDVLVMIARRNGVKDPVVCLVKKSVQETDASYSIIDLFKYKSTTKRVLLMAYNWFVCSFIAYSLTFAAGDMGKNQYINLFLSSVVELPMALLNAVILDKKWCGRKRALAASLFISGVACFGLMAFSPGVKNSFKLSIGLGGKMAISCSFGIIYIYSPELFPTVVRNVSMGSLSMVSRFGGILASFAKTSVETNPKVAYLTFGLTGITSGLFSLFLPETLGTKPPDSFEDLEKEERKKKSVREKGAVKGFSLTTRKKLGDNEEAELLVQSSEEEEQL